MVDNIQGVPLNCSSATPPERLDMLTHFSLPASFSCSIPPTSPLLLILTWIVGSLIGTYLQPGWEIASRSLGPICQDNLKNGMD
jgi:hypothetical protein